MGATGLTSLTTSSSAIFSSVKLALLTLAAGSLAGSTTGASSAPPRAVFVRRGEREAWVSGVSGVSEAGRTWFGWDDGRVGGLLALCSRLLSHQRAREQAKERTRVKRWGGRRRCLAYTISSSSVALSE